MRATGSPGVILLASATAGLLTIFQHLRQTSSRRTVVVPAYTCPLVVLAARQAGLTVIACDVARDRFDFDLTHLASLIGSDTLCVVATHYGGWLTDVARVRAVLAIPRSGDPDRGRRAQAFGAGLRSSDLSEPAQRMSVGLAGDVGVFSFAAGKGLTTFEGGAIVSRSPALLRALATTSRSLVSRCNAREVWLAAQLAGYHLVYNRLGIRFAYGLPTRYWLSRGNEIEAAGDRFEGSIANHTIGRWRRGVAANAIPRLAAHLATTRATFDRLADALADLATHCPGLDVHVPPPDMFPSATFLFVTLPATPRTADHIVALWRSRLGVAKLFTRAIGDYPDLAGLIVPSQTPNARDLAARTMTISTSGAWSGQDIETMVQAIGALWKTASDDNQRGVPSHR